ncbi:MAG: DNA-3-methyladenine glycosylase [Actinomycetota bacterium]|nr:DNA-3-methyladenine glycosylase [Actinomycetota bacterium]
MTEGRSPRTFYSRPAAVVAVDLVGRTLFHETDEGLTAGRIVEVEAYGGSDDPASHAFRGMTMRNAAMFGPPGHLYVYFTYGMHFCANVVTEKDGIAGAVLLRAVEPTIGLELMAERRGVQDIHKLAKGPARLCQAFGLSKQHNGVDLVKGQAWIGRHKQVNGPIEVTERIGLSAGNQARLRYFEQGPWVSGPKSLAAGSAAGSDR